MHKLNIKGELSEVALHVTQADSNETNQTSLISLEQFIAAPESAANIAGIWVSSDASVEAITPHVNQLKVIAIDFPAFTDGRGFSLAAQLKGELSFQGELLAKGQFIQDQLFYLRRCGFDGFLFDDGEINAQQLQSMTESLADFTEVYQASVDQPLPLYRRRATS